MDGTLKQVLSAQELSPHFLVVLQQHLRRVVLPRLAELDDLRQENARLREQLAERDSTRLPRVRQGASV